MFKTTPFKKAKDGSKTIVGRIVEVGEKGVVDNENQRPVDNIAHDYDAKSSTPFRKGAISASVSKIFAGHNTAASSSTTRTPGRKLLKKLICTPGKARSFPDTSISDADDFGVHIPNNSFDLPSFSQEESSIHGANRSGPEGTASSPQKLAQNFPKTQDANPHHGEVPNPRTESPARASGGEMPGNTTGTKQIDDALVAASDHSDRNEDMLFLTTSTSSDETDERNETRNESDPMSRLASSQYHSPRRTSPTKAMRSPGISIPTPSMVKLRETSSGSHTEDYLTAGSGIQFPHTFRSSSDVPMEEQNNTAPNPKNLSTQFEEDDDDDAFLPDDFDGVAMVQPVEKSFTLAEVEKKINDARREERIQLRMQHDKILREKENEFEQVLIDSGTQWKKDSDEQEAIFQRRLKEEERKVSKKHHELINKVQSLDDLTTTLKETEGERDSLKSRIDQLEASAQTSSDSRDQELGFLRNAKAAADTRIAELESELSSKESLEAATQRHQDSNNELTRKLSDTEIELAKLKTQVKQMSELQQEKEVADQKVAELSENVGVLTKSYDHSQSQLEDTLKEIALLKEQLAELPSVDPEEIRSSKLEVENLRKLRTEDEKEIEALQSQLGQIVREHQDMCTPQKKKPSTSYSESPCVGEIDMLRVDYNKAQDQLKSMGKILKRYKSERDDVKAKVQELEQGRVQTVEIAVKQAKEDQKEKREALAKENEALRNQLKTKDIAEQIVEEMKEHIEELKKRHEEKVSQLMKSMDDLKDNTDEEHKLRDAHFETERRNLVEEHEKEIETMKQYIQKIQTNETDEIERLRAELCQIKADFENEKAEIIKTKTKECDALGDQMTSMHELHTEELELLASERQEEVDDLNSRIAQLENLLSAKPVVPEESIQDMRSNFEESLKEVRGEAKTERDRLQAKIDVLQDEKNAQIKKIKDLEVEIGEIQAESEARREKEKNEYSRQIYELKKNHGTESDELLAQLDLFEAETDQRCKAAENAIKEKDAVISALGTQLAESESRSISATNKYKNLKHELKTLRNDMETANAKNEMSQIEIADLIAEHGKEMEEQIVLREVACNEAREEMIALAEGQLAERQEIYQALKRELDSAQSKISVLERDLRFATKEVDEISRRYEGQEADLRDELAQTKAVLATKEANLVRVGKKHEAELDRVKKAEKAMKSKLEEAQTTSHSLQKALASTLTEKQRIETELAEVTAISEELATMLEGNKTH